MLPPLFPGESPKLELDLLSAETAVRSDVVVPSQQKRSFSAVHAGFWAMGATALTVFGLVAFLAVGIVTSSPSTASERSGAVASNSDLGNVYGTWTDLPPDLTDDDQASVFDAQSLEAALAAIIERNSGHEFGLVVAPVGEGDQVRFQDDRIFTGASTTKLLTAAAILSRVDDGSMRLDQIAYRIEPAPAKTEEDKGSTESTPTPSPTPSPTPTPEPKPVTVQQALQRMINRSDNIAWESLIKMLGSRSLRQYAVDLGMQEYSVTDNKVSPRDMALLLQKIYTGQLLSESSTQLLLSHMQNTNEERMIPAAITESGEVYHKYGWLGSVVHDVAIVDNFGTPVVVVLMSDGNSSYSSRTQILRELAEEVEQALLAGHQ